ncbi:sarcosine oxidase [Streptomyces sp. 2231.1]|nr:FAD-dependent oxidoreductase [Streptomyces sp. 2231.1]SEC54971.1 sarcosine oxidase [Streptomyces sp. 2231.1]
MSPSYDVVVIGLGGMGGAAAHHLSARGTRVLGLERFGPVHSRGSSHGGSRITRQPHFEDPAYVPLLLRAYELYEDLARATDREIAVLCGGVMIGRPESRTVAGSLRSAERRNLPHEMLDAKEIRRRLPTLSPDDDEVALYESSGRPAPAREHGRRPPPDGHPAGRCAALRGTGAALGSVPLRCARPHGREHVHRRPAGDLPRRVGAAVPRRRGGAGHRRAAGHVLVPAEGRHRTVRPRAPEHHPVCIWEDAAGVQVYGFPAIDGPERGAKVAFFRKGRVTTPETVDRTVDEDEDEVTAMANHMARCVPELPGTFLKAATCMYSTTPDEHFVIDRHPVHPESVTVACGFSGHGFKFVPVVGEILADLALTGSTAHPIGLFDPARLAAAPA